MRMNVSLAPAALLPCLIVAAPIHAAEMQRLQLDLDGDGRAETVTLAIAPAAKESRKWAVVRLGRSEYKADFFAGQKEIPSLSVMTINWGNSPHAVLRHQLLLMTPEAGSCVYHVLAAGSGHLDTLLRFDSGADCRAPEPAGNGTISTHAWQAFWFREERYRLTASGTSLVRVPQDTYEVKVAGAAAKPLLLENAGCSSQQVTVGQYLRVESFDAQGHRYLVKTPAGACGWLPASEVEWPAGSIAELPKAG